MRCELPQHRQAERMVVGTFGTARAGLLLSNVCGVATVWRIDVEPPVAVGVRHVATENLWCGPPERVRHSPMMGWVDSRIY